MGDAVADRDALDASATSLNRQSWGFEEEQRSTDTTPLLRRQKKKKAPPSGSRDGKRVQEALGRETSASYSALADSDDEKRGLFVTRTVFGEVLVFSL